MNDMPLSQIIAIILTSTVISSIISAVVSKRTNDKNERRKYITRERENWRKDIRDKVTEIISDIDGDKFEYEAYFRVRLNPYDFKDAEILQLLRSMDKNNLESIQEFTHSVSKLLKHDWERVKEETETRIRPYKLPIYFIITSVLIWIFKAQYDIIENMIKIEGKTIKDILWYYFSYRSFFIVLIISTLPPLLIYVLEITKKYRENNFFYRLYKIFNIPFRSSKTLKQETVFKQKGINYANNTRSKKMKNILKYILTIRKELLLLLIISISTYFIIELVLNRINELFNGAYYVGQFFSKISIAYISAFIFYFIVVHIKNEKDKNNINEYVGHKISSIITDAHLFIVPFLSKTDPKATFKYLNKEELNKLLSTIKRDENGAPLRIGGFNGRNANWVEWYEYLKESTLKAIEEIFIRYNHLDSELIKLLTRVQNCVFYTQHEILYNTKHIETFEIYVYQTSVYLTHINNLEEYANEHLMDYENITSEYFEGKPS